eukprot:2836921-Rhodomonas_salina.6
MHARMRLEYVLSGGFVSLIATSGSQRSRLEPARAQASRYYLSLHTVSSYDPYLYCCYEQRPTDSLKRSTVLASMVACGATSMGLRFRCALRSTEIGYGATRLRPRPLPLLPTSWPLPTLT